MDRSCRRGSPTLHPYLLLVTLAGVCLGIFWGAMPGLSTTMAMMLLIGLSVGMTQEVALAFMTLGGRR